MKDQLQRNSKEIGELLDHPTTLRIFLYMRLQSGYIGVRETQRDLGIKSPSTVSWHLDKLAENGYIEKNDANQYALSSKGRMVGQVQVPINISFQLISQRMVSSKVVQLSFLLVSVLIGAFLIRQNPLWASIFLLLVLVSLGVLIYKEFRSIHNQLSNILDGSSTER